MLLSTSNTTYSSSLHSLLTARNVVHSTTKVSEHVGDIPDVSGMQSIINSMPDEILSEIVNVQRTETTNTAEIRIFTKQENGTYSPNVQHGVLTLIPAGQGPDGVNGAGLMSAADKQKLDSIDADVIAGLAESLVWGSL